MTFVAGFIQAAYFIQAAQQALNGVDEGKARMGEGRRDEEVASSKKNRIGAKIDTLFMNGGKMAKINTQFTV